MIWRRVVRLHVSRPPRAFDRTLGERVEGRRALLTMIAAFVRYRADASGRRPAAQSTAFFTSRL